MADNRIPPELAAKAKQMVEASGIKANSVPVQAEKQSPAMDSLSDGGKGLALAREQARQTERQAANHDHKQPSPKAPGE